MDKKYLLTIVFIITIVSISIVYSDGNKVLEEPQISFVSHTEYWSSTSDADGEKAATIIRIVDRKGLPFPVDECNATILYPNKTAYISNEPMSESGIPGNWYRTDPVPPAEGTYEQEVTCLYGNEFVITSQSFHVNPALNFIKNVSADVIASDTRLENINLTITGQIAGTQETIIAKINTTETNLDSLMNNIYTNITNQLNEIDVNTTDLENTIDKINISIIAQIEGTEQIILTQISATETNLEAVMTDTRNNLSAQLDNLGLSLDTGLTNVQTMLAADIADTETIIITQISATESTLDALINSAHSNLSAQLDNTNVSLDNHLTNVQATLSATIAGTENSILLNISDTETNLNGLINSVYTNMTDYMGLYLPALNETATNIYTDTQWLISNAMNQQDKGEIDNRFDAVDNNLSLLISFCSNTATNTSALCQEIYSTRSILENTKLEQADYFSALNSTTMNTYDYLTSTMAENINTLLNNINTILGLTQQINSTVDDMRQDQLNEVHINIIS